MKVTYRVHNISGMGASIIDTRDVKGADSARGKKNAVMKAVKDMTRVSEPDSDITLAVFEIDRYGDEVYVVTEFQGHSKSHRFTVNSF
jgi:hypothetical protein